VLALLDGDAGTPWNSEYVTQAPLIESIEVPHKLLHPGLWVNSRSDRLSF